MNTLKWFVLMVMVGVSSSQAQQAAQTASSQAASAVTQSASAASVEVELSVDQDADRRDHRRERADRNWEDAEKNDQQRGDSLLVIQGDATLAANETTDAVVAIMGNAEVAGRVRESVVAVMGNSRVTGAVGDDVVTVLGNSYINSHVEGDVVTVMGTAELGPQAVIDGEVTTIGGTLKRDVAAVFDRSGTFSAALGNMDWLQVWVKKCLLYGRWLAFDAHVAWAWWLAALSLLSYVATAAMVPKTVSHCVQVLEQKPGHSLLAALCAVPLVPMLMFLLVVTIVGLLALPFVGLALLCMSWFGKLVMLAWLGKKILRRPAELDLSITASWVVPVLLGGVLVTLLYTIPVVGMISSQVIKFIGFGVVLYTLLLMFQRPSGSRIPPSGQTYGSTYGSAATFTSDAAKPEPEMNSTELGGDAEHSAASNISANAEITNELAGFWQRIGALLIDALILSVIAKYMLLGLAIYGAVMWHFKGTTLGGMVFHLQVVRMDGRAMDWSTCIVRALSCFLSLFALGLGFIWIAFDKDKQAWHDKLAGTVVVRTRTSKPLV